MNYYICNPGSRLQKMLKVRTLKNLLVHPQSTLDQDTNMAASNKITEMDESGLFTSCVRRA